MQAILHAALSIEGWTSGGDAPEKTGRRSSDWEAVRQARPMADSSFHPGTAALPCRRHRAPDKKAHDGLKDFEEILRLKSIAAWRRLTNI